ncbi:MAG: tetratricopeptide repeat protein [Chloroflexota bacterium]
MKNFRLFIYFAIFAAAALAYGCGSSKPLPAQKAGPSQSLDSEDDLAQYYVDSVYLASLAREHVIAGATFEQQGKYAEAAIEYQQAAKYVRSPDIYFAQAKAFRLLGKPDLLRDAISDALKLDSNYTPAIELLAWSYLEEMDVKNAEPVLQKLISLEPSYDNKLALAELYRYDNPEEAIKIYEEVYAKTKRGDVKDALFALYQERGFIDKMTRFAEKLYNESPNDLNEAGRYADVLIRYRNYDKAAEVVDTLLARNPDETLAPYFDYFIKTTLEDTTDQARSFLLRVARSAANRFSEQPEINSLSGYIFEVNRDSARAERIFSDVAATEDATSEYELQYINFFRRHADSARAENLFLEYSRRFERDEPFLLSYVYYLVDGERFNESLSLVKKLLTIAPDSLNFTLLYADITNKTGDYALSDSLYESILRAEPFNAMANNNFAFALAERGIDLRRALVMSGTSLSADPENPYYLDTYGYILYRMSKYEEALDYLTRAANARPDSYEVYEHLGDVYAELGKRDEARESFNRALLLKPDDERIAEKLRKVK